MQGNTDKCHLLLSTVEKVTMDVQYLKNQSDKFLDIENLCKNTILRPCTSSSWFLYEYEKNDIAVKE